jgi:hypothetical protein
MIPNMELIQYGNGVQDLERLYLAYSKIWNYCKKGTWSLEESREFAKLRKDFPGLYELASNKINGVHVIRIEQWAIDLVDNVLRPKGVFKACQTRT